MSNTKTATNPSQAKLPVGKFLIAITVVALFGAAGYKAYQHTGDKATPTAPALETEATPQLNS